MEANAERGWLARWEHFWFGEASLVCLAAFRIILLAAAFDGVWLVQKSLLQRATQLDPVFLRRTFDPIYAFELLGLGPPGPNTVRIVWAVMVAAIVLGILGLFALRLRGGRAARHVLDRQRVFLRQAASHLRGARVAQAARREAGR
ncbi:MAG: hypothetical protein HOP15_08275 [Planctomycetes bacterium]|nr:hypothetical protein [Planctomycetota bacterium]